MTRPLPTISPHIIQDLLNAGATSLEALKEAVLAFLAALEGLATLQTSLQAPGVQNVLQALPAPLSNVPVTEDVLAGWNPTGVFLSDKEVQARVKAVSAAVASEKWSEGFALALSLISTMGGAL